MWTHRFLKRDKSELYIKRARKIKTARAKISPAVINSYLDELKNALQEVPNSNVLNYDESGFFRWSWTQDCTFCRGVKYLVRIRDNPKSHTMVIFEGTPDQLLPLYVVYKAKKLWSTWTDGGPARVFYGRTESGWVDTASFVDFFEKVVFPWGDGLHGPKAVRGDNLSTHFSQEVIKQCQEKQMLASKLYPPAATSWCFGVLPHQAFLEGGIVLFVNGVQELAKRVLSCLRNTLPDSSEKLQIRQHWHWPQI